MSVHLAYPPQIKDGSTGKVELSCTVGITGDLENCTVTDVQGGQPFADLAQREVRRAHYSPAWEHGKPVPETDRHVTLVFVPPPDPFPVSLAPPSGVLFGKPTFGTRLAYKDILIDRHQQGSALVFCDLGQDGVNRNCAIGGVHGDPAFGAAALAHVSSEVVHATRAGMPVAVAHRAYVVTFSEDLSVW